MLPCATTPLPSLNRSGRMPVYTTGTVLAVSVTLKRTVRPSLWRLRLPASTMPPIRNVRPCGTSFARTCVGLKKKTRLLWKALRISPAATPSTARPPAIRAILLCRGFMYCCCTTGCAPQRHSRHGKSLINADLPPCWKWAAERKKLAAASFFSDKPGLLLRQHVFDRRLDLGVRRRDLGMALTFLQLRYHCGRIGLLGRDILERGSDLLLIDGV